MATRIKKFSPVEVDKKLLSLPGWTANKAKSQISKTFTFPTYINGLAFVARIAVYAEVLQHHPDMELAYKEVTIKLTTHDVKGLTTADFEMAKKIERIIDNS